MTRSKGGGAARSAQGMQRSDSAARSPIGGESDDDHREDAPAGRGGAPSSVDEVCDRH